MAGRHRKPSPLPPPRTLVALLCLALVMAAAGFAVVADDPSLLRAAAVLALVGAFPAVLLGSQDATVSSTASLECELRRLRADVARLTGTVAVLETRLRPAAVAPTPPAPPATVPRLRPLTLPATPGEPAAAQRPTIDVTDAALRRSA